jgi:hypothetical protein
MDRGSLGNPDSRTVAGRARLVEALLNVYIIGT